MTDETELKPCPFCGGKASLENSDKGAFVGCMTSDCPAASRLFMSQRLAVEKWNTRPDTPKAGNAEALKALKRKIDPTDSPWSEGIDTGWNDCLDHLAALSQSPNGDAEDLEYELTNLKQNYKTLEEFSRGKSSELDAANREIAKFKLDEARRRKTPTGDATEIVGLEEAIKYAEGSNFITTNSRYQKVLEAARAYLAIRKEKP